MCFDGQVIDWVKCVSLPMLGKHVPAGEQPLSPTAGPLNTDCRKAKPRTPKSVRFQMQFIYDVHCNRVMRGDEPKSLLSLQSILQASSVNVS